MQVYNNISEMIGNTPILKINHIDLPDGVNLLAKLEFYNPGGSVKDRIGEYIIKQAEKEGSIKPGATIVEATAGNTGIGVALAAMGKGYKVVFVVPEKFSVEKQVIMRSLGAEVINTPEKDGLKGAFNKVEELKEEIKNVFVVDQFNNPHNPGAHYHTTGKEIFEQLSGNVDYVVAGAGSGGTITGVMQYLKEHNPSVKGVLADPEGSIIGGGTCGSYKIEGIGNDFIPQTLNMKYIDEVFKVNDDEAFKAVKDLAKDQGIMVGSSSGAAMVAALKLAKNITHGNIVVIFPDRADRYISKGIFE